jgi:hypothetical protein
MGVYVVLHAGWAQVFWRRDKSLAFVRMKPQFLRVSVAMFTELSSAHNKTSEACNNSK